jgi:uncharacterized membrane protein YfcA
VTFATGAFLFFAAVLGGAINSVAGGGSFIAFPALLFAGAAPIRANATNTIALWPGSAASVVAYRRELHGVRREFAPLGAAALIGGCAGSFLLLRTPEHAFVLLIPWLLLFATVLFSFGRVLGGRALSGRVPLSVGTVVQLVFSVYAGYFGGGTGILMLGLLSLMGMTDIHRMNALKTALAAIANGAAVVAFIAAGAVDWTHGIVMVGGGIAGGYAGAAIARRVDPRHVRLLVLAIAWAMTVFFFVKTYR